MTRYLGFNAHLHASLIYIIAFNMSNLIHKSMLRIFAVSNKNVLNTLTHWGRVTHICVSNLTIIGSDNGLSPDRRQAIIWTNSGILLTGPLGTNFSEILIQNSKSFIQENAFESVVCEMAAILSRPQCVNSKPYVSFQWRASYKSPAVFLKFGKIMRRCIKFHSYKDSWVNPA